MLRHLLALLRLSPAPPREPDDLWLIGDPLDDPRPAELATKRREQ